MTKQQRIFLEDNDVLQIEVKLNPCGHATSTVHEMNRALCANNVGESWVKDGIECSVLFENSNGWRKGKVRVKLEFIPDEGLEGKPVAEREMPQKSLAPSSQQRVESELDDMRRKFLGKK